MPSGFHDVRFPTDISYGSEGGPEFSTEVTELSSGHEQRNINWQYPRERWNVAYGVNTEAKLKALNEFFYARRGKAFGFRFKNHFDFETPAPQLIGEGDSSETEFQLVRLYTSGPSPLSRIITKPIANTVLLYLDSIPQVGGWTVNDATGIVTFSSPPSIGVDITAFFQWDVPMRFDTDHIPLRFVDFEAMAASVPLLEIRV